MAPTVELPHHQLRAGEVVPLTEEPRAGGGVLYHTDHITVGVNTADMQRVTAHAGTVSEQQRVLIDEHPDADAVHVEAVEEVLDVVLGGAVDAGAVLELDDPLGHRLHDVAVAVANVGQGFAETAVNRGVTRGSV